MSQTLKFGNKTWATKVGSTLAYNDENGNYKPLPFAFTRSTSATRINKEGLIEVVTNDRPRIDYTDTSDGVLLLEKAATNLVTYSEDFSNAAWLKGGATVLGGFTSPSVNNNAYKLIENSNNSTHYVGMTGQALNASYSVFAKKGERNWILLTSHWSSGSGLRGQYFDLENGVVGTGGSANGTIEDYGNGWYRCSIDASSSPSSLFVLMLSTGDGQSLETYTGDGTSGIYIYGAQNTDITLSSYIPTQGSATTRVAETATDSGNSEVFNDSQGVLFLDFAAISELDNNRFSLGSGSGTVNKININTNPSDNLIQFYISDSINSTAITSSSVITTNYNKCALKYSNTEFYAFVNGFKTINGTPRVPSGLNNISFNRGDNVLNAYIKTKEIGYYNTILTDLELETLTSYKSWTSMVNELNLNIIYNG